MTAIEIAAVLACLTISGVLIVRSAITSALHNAELIINDALTELDQPTDRTVREWVRIRTEYAPDEYELLRRADRMMAGTEAAILRDWQDRPYDVDADGGI